MPRSPFSYSIITQPLSKVIPMTLGELALWLRDTNGLDMNLSVLPVRDSP